MKNLNFGLLLCLGLLGCDTQLGEVIIAKNKIDLKIYYEASLPSHIQTQDGFILGVRRDITNGDSIKCHLVARRELVYTKIDFQGRKLWEYIAPSTDKYFNNLVEDRNGFFWSITDNELIQQDERLNVVSRTTLNFTPFAGTFVNISYPRIRLLPSGEIIMVGYINRSGSMDKFICKVSPSGVSEFKALKTNVASAYYDNFYVLSNSEILLEEDTHKGATLETKLLLSYFSPTFQLLREKRIDIQSSATYSVHKRVIGDTWYGHIGRAARLIEVAPNLDVRDVQTGLGDVNEVFVYDGSLYLNDYNKGLYLVKNTDLSVIQLADKAQVPSKIIRVEQTPTGSTITGINTIEYPKSRLDFQRNINGVIQKQPLFVSDYTRNCWSLE